MGQQFYPNGSRQIIQFGSKLTVKLHVPGHFLNMRL